MKALVFLRKCREGRIGSEWVSQRRHEIRHKNYLMGGMKNYDIINQSMIGQVLTLIFSLDRKRQFLPDNVKLPRFQVMVFSNFLFPTTPYCQQKLMKFRTFRVSFGHSVCFNISHTCITLVCPNIFTCSFTKENSLEKGVKYVQSS